MSESIKASIYKWGVTQNIWG